MFLQTATENAPGLTDNNRILTILAESDIVIQIIFGILLCFSLASWAIIFLKGSQLTAARRNLRAFSARFQQSASVDQFIKSGELPKGAGLHMLQGGLQPLSRTPQGGANDVTRGIDRNMSEAVSMLEQYLPFLATTASATPFVGLLGTVWGILNAFWEISTAGSSSLQVVGPSIAEALFVTAVGLVAAIPALIFYNLFNNKIRLLTRELGQLQADLEARFEQEYFTNAA